MKSFRLALSFLTLIPAGTQKESKIEMLARSTMYFPAIGTILGLAFAAAAYLGFILLGSGPAAALVLLLSFILSRGLHVDGLADTADGLAGGTDKQRSLTIMRDSVVGPMGACSILLVYLLKYAALAAAGMELFILMAFLMPLCGRWNMVLAGTVFSPARKDGLGSKFINKMKWHHFTISSAISAAILAITIYCTDTAFISPVCAGTGAAIVVSYVFALLLAKRLGGLTGDVLGAVNEVAEASFLLGALGAGVGFS